MATITEKDCDRLEGLAPHNHHVRKVQGLVQEDALLDYGCVHEH